MSTAAAPVKSGKAISVQRAAELLGVSRTTVYRYIEEDLLKGWHFKRRGQYKVSYDSVIDLLNRAEEGPPT